MGISPARASDRAQLDRALSFAAEHAEGAVAALARMVAVDTSFPPGAGYGRFADVLEELFAPLGFAYRRVTVPRELWETPGGKAAGERVNLIASGFPRAAGEAHGDTTRPREWHQQARERQQAIYIQPP